MFRYDWCVGDTHAANLRQRGRSPIAHRDQVQVPLFGRLTADAMGCDRYVSPAVSILFISVGHTDLTFLYVRIHRIPVPRVPCPDGTVFPGHERRHEDNNPLCG